MGRVISEVNCNENEKQKKRRKRSERKIVPLTFQLLLFVCLRVSVSVFVERKCTECVCDTNTLVQAENKNNQVVLPPMK